MSPNQMYRTYLQMLSNSLAKKESLLAEIYHLTKEQESAFTNEENTIEIMEHCMDKKEPLIEQINQLDAGFDSVFDKIKESVLEDKELYKEELKLLQGQIAALTELGVKIQSLEQSNKLKFEVFLSSKKTEIKQFMMSSQTVSNYYKNMTGNAHGESYFIDKKK